MARIGKCKEENCDGEILVGSYGNWQKQCDGTGFCNKCFKEYKLEYKGRSNNLTLMPLEGK